MLTQNDKFLVTRNGNHAGPFTIEQFKEMLRTRQITNFDLIWQEGMTDWRPLGEVFSMMNQTLPLSANLMPVPPAVEKEESAAQLIGQMAGGCFLWIALLGLALGGGIIFPLLLVLLPIALIGGLIDMGKKLVKLLKRKAQR